MSTLQAFILGAVQGLTEFLPISSSGHLLVIEKLMGISSESGSLLTLNILLHFGTLVAVFAVYWRRIWNMICHPIKSELKWLIVATIPAVVAALVVDFDAAFEGKFKPDASRLYRYTTRIDGFACYQAPSAEEVRVTTKPFVLSGTSLSLNFAPAAPSPAAWPAASPASARRTSPS